MPVRSASRIFLQHCTGAPALAAALVDRTPGIRLRRSAVVAGLWATSVSRLEVCAIAAAARNGRAADQQQRRRQQRRRQRATGRRGVCGHRGLQRVAEHPGQLRAPRSYRYVSRNVFFVFSTPER